MSRYEDVDEILHDLTSLPVPCADHGMQTPSMEVRISPPGASGRGTVTARLTDADVAEDLSEVVDRASIAASQTQTNIDLYVERCKFGMGGKPVPTKSLEPQHYRDDSSLRGISQFGRELERAMERDRERERERERHRESDLKALYAPVTPSPFYPSTYYSTSYPVYTEPRVRWWRKKKSVLCILLLLDILLFVFTGHSVALSLVIVVVALVLKLFGVIP